jgi:SynChlorMet cassette protein ScmD
MKNDEKPIANPSVMLREEFDDWAILFNPDTNHGFGLSPTGVYVWKLLDGEHTVDELLREIRFYADKVPEEAREHVSAFIDELVAEGLAGCDHIGCGPQKSSSRPLGPLSEMKPFRYEPPKLIYFRQRAVAQGYCYGGSQNCGGCVGGGQPAVGCTPGGSHCYCQPGTTNTIQCECGTTPGTGNYCGAGGCDYVSCGGGSGASCHTGVSAAGGACVIGTGH